MAEDECSSMKPRRTKKRKGIPVPSFASSDEPANEKKESSLSTSRADKKAKPPPHKSVAVATKQKDKQKHDEEQEQQQQQQEQSLTRQRPRTSRIAMSLCFQRDRQRLDPSLPQYYTRKERRIMNDETPERAGDEEVEDYFYPVALENTKSQAQATLEEKAAAAIFSDDPSSPKTSSSTAKSLFDRNSIDGSASPWSPLATQKFHETEKHVKAFCPEFPHPEQKKESSEAQTAVATKKLVPRSSLFFSPESDDTKEFTEKRTAILTKKPVPQGSHENSQSQSNGQSSNAVFGKANDTEVSQEKSQSQNSAQAKSVVSSNSEQKVPEAAAKPAVAAPAKAPPPPSFRLYFVQKGRDMYKEILVGPKRNARIRGAVVLDRFDRHKTDDPLQMPTQLVVGSSASPAAISKALGFETVEELRHFMFEHDIQCVTRSWAAKESKEPYQAPRRDLFLPPGVESEIHKDLTPLAPSRPADGSSPGSRKASFDRRGPPRAARASEPQRNVALAKLFKKLSKAYQAAPLDPIDTWRAYTFATASSRLRALSFEIKSDQDICRVKNTKGFGSSSMEIIREFVAKQQEEEDDEVVAEDSDDHITCERLQNVLADPQRQSLKRFMNIWGVGRVKALELVQAGYSSIDEIKNDFDQSCLRVQILRNQYIGLINYDDILEEMDRAEATRIGELVRKAVLDRYPQAEVEIMGSYRRGAESCGDVDILIVHRNYDERVCFFLSVLARVRLVAVCVQMFERCSRASIDFPRRFQWVD